MTPRTRRLVLSLSLVGAVIAASACGSDSGSKAFTLSSSPEYVNRIIPGHRPVALVAVGGDTGKAVDLTASTTLTGATVTFSPASVKPGGVAEVWMDVPAVTEDTPFTLAVTGTRGSATQSLSVSATAVPGIDDIQETALQIAAVFLKELHGTTVLGLPSDVSGLSGGTPVAGLLVVTHYAWFTDEYEIGLAWHIMVAPDDWSDIYFRPRGALRPTAAYRLSSWSTALAGGSYTVTPTTLPTEVMR